MSTKAHVSSTLAQVCDQSYCLHEECHCCVGVPFKNKWVTLSRNFLNHTWLVPSSQIVLPNKVQQSLRHRNEDQARPEQCYIVRNHSFIIVCFSPNLLTRRNAKKYEKKDVVAEKDDEGQEKPKRRGGADPGDDQAEPAPPAPKRSRKAK